MTTEVFDHLMSFGIAGAQVPVRKAQLLLATRAQREALETILREEEPTAPSLAETREPDLAKVNYTDAVRGDIWDLWKPLVEAPEHVPPVQLLERLDSTWKTAEQKLGEDVQGKATELFTERSQGKAQILAAEASRLAVEQGLPATLQWLGTLKQECTEARKCSGRELHSYIANKKQQLDNLHKRKEAWVALLSCETEDLGELARRLLLLASGVLLTGCFLWFLNIAATSLVGLAIGVCCAVLAWRTIQPLFRRLRISNRITRTAAQLASAYRASSLASLDELVKRLEMAYPETVRQHIVYLQDAYRRRLSLLETRRQELAARTDATQKTLLDAPPTIRVLLRNEALEEWYEQGKVQVLMTDWRQRLVALLQEPDWGGMESEARQAFAFLHVVRAEAELYRLYPRREARQEFLQSLRDAAIGPTPGEALLALDFAATAGKPPQVHVLVELDDPQSSELAKDILSEWAGAGVGVTIDRTSDPAAISLIGVVYSYSMAAQKGWESIEAAFRNIHKQEGRGIYPVLFPSTTQEGETR